MATPDPSRNAPQQYGDVSEKGLRLVMIVAGVMAASLMQTLDTTITNVALPNIQGNLGASQDEGTWIVTAYTIAAIVIIPITPWLQNRFGRKNYYVASIVGFTLASLMCGRSGQLFELVFWRAVQGMFGGGLLATGQSILRDTFPPAKLGISQGIFVLGAVLGPALGPPLGGILVDRASWSLIFDINVLPGIFATIVLLTLLRDPLAARKTAVDGIGLALLATGLGTMQYVLTEGERNYWFASLGILCATLVSIVSLSAFVFWELYRARIPVVDLRVLRNRSVSAGSILAVALGAALFGTSYVLPQFTQGPLGFTPTVSGELFIIRAIPVVLITPLVVRLVTKIDARVLLGLGFFLIGVGALDQGFITAPQASFWTFAFSLVTIGAGTAMLFVPLTIAVLGATKPQDGPKASAFINLSTQLGGSIAVAMLDVVLDRRWSFHSAVLGGRMTLSNLNVQRFLQHGTQAELARLVNAQAAILAYADATFAIAALALVSVPLIFLMRKPARAGSGP